MEHTAEEVFLIEIVSEMKKKEENFYNDFNGNIGYTVDFYEDYIFFKKLLSYSKLAVEGSEEVDEDSISYEDDDAELKTIIISYLQNIKYNHENFVTDFKELYPNLSNHLDFEKDFFKDFISVNCFKTKKTCEYHIEIYKKFYDAILINKEKYEILKNLNLEDSSKTKRRL